jgi:retron-type reverse transcriptase
MDCIALLDSYINNRSKYYWIIEGDIKGAFDHIHHEILVRLLTERIVDQRLLDLVDRFLKAGIMEGSLFKHTELGTPQGAICSPLLANISNWIFIGGINMEASTEKRRNAAG